MIAAFCSRCVGMHPDMAGVDHQPFIIRLINQNFQEFFPNTFSTPTDKPLMNTAPLPVIGRQVTPGRSSSQNPKYCVDKTAVILSNPAPLASLPGQMRFKQLLYFVIYTMSVIGCIHLSLSRLFRYFHFITIQTSCVDAIHANSQSLFNISTCMDWRVDFLPCKAKIRRHPDGWQGFLTQSGRKIRRQDMRGEILNRLSHSPFTTYIPL